MTIQEHLQSHLDDGKATISIERPIRIGVENEILYTGLLSNLLCGAVKNNAALLSNEFNFFSVNSPENKLRADIVYYLI